jgi:hypothetical protein
MEASKVLNITVTRSSVSIFTISPFPSCIRHYGIRYDYYLSKRSNLYAGVVWIRNEQRAAVTINRASSPGIAVTRGGDPRAVVLGVRPVF